MSNFGKYEGDVCNRKSCDGLIAVHPSDNCSCHISPPCSSCTAPRHFCPVCQWEESQDEILNDHLVNYNPQQQVYKDYGLRELNNSKIDWHSLNHTHFTMIKRGVYPEGVTMEEVRKLVIGTFGGRFNYFDKGEFEYVAYTD